MSGYMTLYQASESRVLAKSAWSTIIGVDVARSQTLQINADRSPGISRLHLTCSVVELAAP
ncbi:hypothetical protein KBZ94_10005 [Streptomyces sp. RM72]|uniref:hypothetical protein n=1 Tax=Streptomyces sp. RM72 TaxID=1115510 RepID=UPI001B375317|nr:hypothetical protein [Streptomyces sp. RM72]MBQ0885272.1 hypothetical protein [Streptomyces sp. RM72]